jgi:hypothetical protein
MENEETAEQEPRTGVRWLWFVGGCALSITTLCSLVLAMLLVGSTAVNAYLGWIISGYEVNLSRAASEPTDVVVSTPASVLVVVPTATPTVTPTITPTPVATLSTLEAEFATLSAIATYVAESAPASTLTPTYTPTPAEVAPPTPAPTKVDPPISSPTEVAPSSPDPTEAPAPTPRVASAPAAAAPEDEADTQPRANLQPLAESTNLYNLIPIEGGRESRPPDEHADLNLKLRDPIPAPFKASLVEIDNAGSDSNAPRLSAVLEPDILTTYAIHDWDWGSNSKGRLIDDGSAVLVGIKTTPGKPVFIPFKGQDIFQGKYYATLLYASEDSLTFVYTRRGNVVEGYTVHYLGLQVDPSLLKLFRDSKGNELPGLTHDVPVGVATDELIVAIRDRGTFLDARSRLDWWR